MYLFTNGIGTIGVNPDGFVDVRDIYGHVMKNGGHLSHTLTEQEIKGCFNIHIRDMKSRHYTSNILSSPLWEE